MCPAGHFSIAQVPCPAHARQVAVTFDRSTCESCPWFHRCPARLNQAADGYTVTVDLTAANLERHRRPSQRPVSGALCGASRHRGDQLGTERGHGLDQLRVRGRLRVELAVYLKALACNCKRMVRVPVAIERGDPGKGLKQSPQPASGPKKHPENRLRAFMPQQRPNSSATPSPLHSTATINQLSQTNLASRKRRFLRGSQT